MTRVPSTVFKTRVRNEALGGPNPFEWKDVSTDDVFKSRNVVVFSLPGAFTPTCSTSHLPRYEELGDEFKAQGVDEIVCLSVNDAFVMFQWGKAQGADKVFLLPDGNGEFTRKMGMLVDKSNLGFGMRSWRYSMYVEDGEIKVGWRMKATISVDHRISDGAEAAQFMQALARYLEKPLLLVV